MNFKIKFCVNILGALVILSIMFLIFQNYKGSVEHIGKKIIQQKLSGETVVEEKQKEPDAEEKQKEPAAEEEPESDNSMEEDYDELPPKKTEDMKNILIWTKSTTVPFVYLGKGQEVVISENCQYQNCYVTDNKNYLSDLTDFDALLFHIPEYVWRGKVYNFGIPEKRAPHQKYVLSCIESAHFYPICDSKYDNFFNWTWTYKLDADVKWGYMAIRDAETHEIVGPEKNMVWKNYENDIVSEEKKAELKKKTRGVAWYVSNCYTKSGREKFARKLGESLNKYGIQIDIYGSCGNMKCERGLQECFDKLKNDYFFYLSFENSFNEDYVTEKFVNAMKYGVVPIVWGGANYSEYV